MDTGADYSVISAELVAELRKVITPWEHGLNLRSAGGHLLTPIGRCTARLQIPESTFVASFIMLRECSRKVILGMDFLREHGAVIDLRKLLVTFSDDHAQTPRDTATQRTALRIVDDAITLPPRTSMFVTVMSDISDQ